MEEAEKKDQVTLPFMMENECCTVYIKLHEGMTQAPKPYTEGQLIKVMKRAGKELEDVEAKETLNQTEEIGTEATRAIVIETLKGQQYITVKKNIVHMKEKGAILCQAVEGSLLVSPEMTAK